MQLVVIESPFKGKNDEQRALYKFYLAAAMLDSLRRGEAPFASHALYPQFLDDNIPEHRALGLACGKRFLACCELVAFYVDHGISPGMQEALDYASKYNIHHEFRYLLGER